MSPVAASRSHAYVPAHTGVTNDRASVGRKGRLSAQSHPPAIAPGKPGSGVLLGLPLSDAYPAAAAKAQTFEHAILPHLDAAYNLARWLTHDQVEAEDIVQDACVRALQYFPSFRSHSGRAWLLRIIRNAVYTKLRTQRTGVDVALGGAGGENDYGGIGMDIADPYPGPEAAFQTTQELTQLKAAVAVLPIDLRECIVLREMEEFSYKEIARITEVPIGTVMSRLHRARRLLSALWTASASRRATTPS